MILADPELHMLARLLIANHGDQAAGVAKELGNRFRERGDPDMAATYDQIGQAITGKEAP